jgi:hypothetical protein
MRGVTLHRMVGMDAVVVPPTTAQLIMQALAKEASARLDAASLISHPHERGRAREEALKTFFREITPAGFEIATGFIIDSSGAQSRQQDLIFVRRDYHPVFRVGGTMFFPVEAVGAVVEVKSHLTTRTLKDALDNGTSVKRLDRTAAGNNYIVVGGSGGMPAGGVEPENHAHQVFTIIVGGSAIGHKALIATVRAYLTGRPRREWPNLIAASQDWSLTYQPVDSNGVRTDQMTGTALRLARASNPANVHPLIDVAEQLWSILRVTPLIDVAPSRYIRGSWISDEDHPLD